MNGYGNGGGVTHLNYPHGNPRGGKRSEKKKTQKWERQRGMNALGGKG